MTNREVETMLRAAAEKMPAPDGGTSFLPQYEETAAKERWSKKPFRPALIAAVLICMFILGTTVYAYTRIAYGMEVTNHIDSSWIFAKILILSDYPVNLSEQYGEYTFSNASENSVVPHGSPPWKAMISPTYRAADIVYKDIDNENDKYLGITIGSMENPYWNVYFDCFNYDDNNMTAVSPDTREVQKTATREYKGIEMVYVLYQYVGEDDIYNKYSCVSWIDEKRNIFIHMSFSMPGNEIDFSMETAFEYAEMVIDENL